MKKIKVTILLDEGSLMYAPSAYIEVRSACLTGGIAARGGGWHVPPHWVYLRRADYDYTWFGETKQKLIERINSRFPDELYIKEYV